MKLSYNKYQVLKLTDKAVLSRMRTGLDALALTTDVKSMSDEELMDANIWYRITDGWLLGKPIYLVHDSFYKAVEDNEHKLAELLDKDVELRVSVVEDCILLIHDKAFVVKPIEDGRIDILTLNIKGEVLNNFQFGLRTMDAKVFYICDDDREFILQCAAAIMKILLFKKYASVELYLIEAGTKRSVRCADRGKVVNETGVDVTLLDSSWFREIIRVEGFSVRGHFRLQPCKNEKGEWTKKLIYIEPFEKHGYHRRARINMQ